MAGSIEEGTLEGLGEFCEWVTKKGLMTSAAIDPLRSAASKIVTTVDADAPNDIRITDPGFDADAYVDRFQKLAGTNYTPDSLVAYRRRFKRAIVLYQQYLDKGAANFSPPKGRAPRFKAEPSVQGGNGSRKNGTSSTKESKTQTTPPDMIQYPFPLASGQVAQLMLPPRLEKEDADRMMRYVQALVFEPQRQISRGDDA